MLNTPQVRKLIELALEEDLPAGDVTTLLTVDPSAHASATIVAREKLVVCGTALVAMILDAFGAKSEVEIQIADGSVAAAEQVIARISGHASDLLSTERVILNFLQRLSGVATATKAVIEQCQGMTILDTRKTTPGWRALEKYAVRIGGARNHRGSLSDMIMVKNNHIDANGGDLRKTMSKVHAARPWYMPVEIEVRSQSELAEALKCKPTVIMLDNMNDAETKKALAFVAASGQSVLVEASGGITVERIPSLKALGVEAVSMSGLCGRARTVDISMRLKLDDGA